MKELWKESADWINRAWEMYNQEWEKYRRAQMKKILKGGQRGRRKAK